MDIPPLRKSVNHHPMLTARQESNIRGVPPTSNEEHWGGRWVPRDADGDWIHEKAFYSSMVMREEYPGIVLFKDGEVYHGDRAED